MTNVTNAGMTTSHPMTLYPAIDILGGRCVRLRRGDFAQARVYDEDPLDVAHRWREQGASWLHLIDLDGARAGRPVHLEVARTIIREAGLPVQYGGGFRSLDAIAAALDAGAARVLLGTAAVRDPALLAECVRRWGECVAVSVDARGDQVAVAGWLEIASEPALVAARRIAEQGVRTLIVTDIDRDGTLAGGAGARIVEMRAALPSVNLIAAGGLAALADLTLLRQIGVDGAVLGRALYEGTIDLAGALRLVASSAPDGETGEKTGEKTAC